MKPRGEAGRSRPTTRQLQGSAVGLALGKAAGHQPSPAPRRPLGAGGETGPPPSEREKCARPQRPREPVFGELHKPVPHASLGLLSVNHRFKAVNKTCVRRGQWLSWGKDSEE